MAALVFEWKADCWYELVYSEGRLQLKKTDRFSKELRLLVRFSGDLPEILVVYPTTVGQRSRFEVFGTNYRQGKYWIVKVVLDLGLVELPFVVKVYTEN